MAGRIRFKAGGRRRPRKGGVMNKTEAEYAAHLQLRLLAGEVVRYRFEKVRLILAETCTYTPDFEVLMPDGTKEFHEVKGHWEDDALVKIKVAAEQFPEYRFLAIAKLAKKAGGGWSVREF
jgi:hypothetical protein